MRLDKFLSDLNIGSRKNVKKLITNGTITVNGSIITNPAEQITPSDDLINLNGKVLLYNKYHYYMLHKPKGIISATLDKNTPCVIDLFKNESVKNLFPVGRLDKDTEGLLLITNDGSFSHKITSPTSNLFKTYYAKLDGFIDSSIIEHFKKGVDIGDNNKTKPAILTIDTATASYSYVHISISEGRYHQIKRMFQAFQLQVLYLKRISIGSLQLDESLPLGEYRLLTKEDIKTIFK